MGAPPPPITIVGGCKTDDFESHGGSQNRPLAARLVWPHQATGVASRAAPSSSATPPSLYAPSRVLRGAGAFGHNARPANSNRLPLPAGGADYRNGRRLQPSTGGSRTQKGPEMWTAGGKSGGRPQNRPDLRITPEKTSTCPQKRPVLRIKVGKTVFRPHLGPILRICRRKTRVCPHWRLFLRRFAGRGRRMTRFRVKPGMTKGRVGNGWGKGGECREMVGGYCGFGGEWLNLYGNRSMDLRKRSKDCRL